MKTPCASVIIEVDAELWIFSRKSTSNKNLRSY